MYMSVKRVYSELVRIGGVKAAYEMHKRFEGEQVNISARKSKFNMMLETLTDKETADEFHDKYKHRISLYVGKLDGLFRDKRDQKMIADYKAGATPSVLAKKYKLCTPWIKKVVGYKPKYPLRNMFKKKT